MPAPCRRSPPRVLPCPHPLPHRRACRCRNLGARPRRSQTVTRSISAHRPDRRAGGDQRTDRSPAPASEGRIRRSPGGTCRPLCTPPATRHRRRSHLRAARRGRPPPPASCSWASGTSWCTTSHASRHPSSASGRDGPGWARSGGCRASSPSPSWASPCAGTRGRCSCGARGPSPVSRSSPEPTCGRWSRSRVPPVVRLRAPRRAPWGTRAVASA